MFVGYFHFVLYGGYNYHVPCVFNCVVKKSELFDHAIVCSHISYVKKKIVSFPCYLTAVMNIIASLMRDIDLFLGFIFRLHLLKDNLDICQIVSLLKILVNSNKRILWQGEKI